MNSQEIYKNYHVALDRDFIIDLIEKIKGLNLKTNDRLELVLLRNKNQVEELDKKSVLHFFEGVLPYSIITNDIETAYKLYNDTSITIDEFKEKIMNNDEATIIKYKEGFISAIKSGNSVVIDSSELYANDAEMVDKRDKMHEITVNASAKNYAFILSDLYSRIMEDKVPFKMTVRLPIDLKEGYMDPIRINVSSKYFDRMLSIVSDVTYMHKDEILEPSCLYERIEDGLYGYTPVDLSKDIIPMSVVCHVLTATIDETINYINDDRLDKSNTTWEARMKNVDFIRLEYPDEYEKMIDNMLNYLKQYDDEIDMENLFTIPKLTVYQDDIDTLNKYTDGLSESVSAVEDVKEEITEPVEEAQNEIVEPAEEVQEETTPVVQEESTPVVEEEHITNDNQDVSVFEQPVVPTITPVDQLITNETSSLPQEVKDEEKRLDDLLASVQPKEDEAPVDEAPYEPIPNEITNEMLSQPEIIPEVKMPQFESTEVQDVVEAVEPIPQDVVDEMINTTQPEVQSDTTVQITDLKDEEVDDEEEKIFNTGAYSIPEEIKTTPLDDGLTSEETQSVVTAPQRGEGLSPEEMSATLGEYEGLLTVEDALTDIVNERGEKVTIIDYLKQHKAEQLFNKVINSDLQENMPGKDFIREAIVPMLKNGYQYDAIITMHSYGMEDIAPTKKENFFSRIFKSKKK